MATHVVRISKRAYYDLIELAARFDESRQAIIEQALESLRRQQMFEEANAIYAELRRDPKVWEEVLAERAVWDGTLADGLEKE